MTPFAVDSNLPNTSPIRVSPVMRTTFQNVSFQLKLDAYLCLVEVQMNLFVLGIAVLGNLGYLSSDNSLEVF